MGSWFRLSLVRIFRLESVCYSLKSFMFTPRVSLTPCHLLVLFFYSRSFLRENNMFSRKIQQPKDIYICDKKNRSQQQQEREIQVVHNLLDDNISKRSHHHHRFISVNLLLILLESLKKNILGEREKERQKHDSNQEDSQKQMIPSQSLKAITFLFLKLRLSIDLL